MSQTPDQPETGREHLRRALHHLPVHEPDAATWSHIEAALATENAVARALPHLPAHEPDDALWTAISAQLDAAPASPLTVTPEPEAAPVRPLWPRAVLRWVSSVAAAVLVLSLAWWQRPASAPAPGATASAPTETISYGEETLPEAPLPAASAVRPGAFEPLEQEGVAFIDSHCSSLPTVCQSSEFKQLRTQLAQLEAEEQRLQREARRRGQTPELEEHKVRVTTRKATVTRELIQLIIS